MLLHAFSVPVCMSSAHLPPSVEKVYCKEYTCSYGYQYKNGYEGILCDDECDDSRCCDEGENGLYNEVRFDHGF